jgi:hypothetical protein
MCIKSEGKKRKRERKKMARYSFPQEETENKN